MKRLFTLTMLLCGSLLAFGQQATISGQVTDESGEALIGANVLVKGSTIGANTDLDGMYSLEVDPGTYTIFVSYVGYRDLNETVMVVSGEKMTLNLTLGTVTDLDMVVVSGSRKPEKITESPATIETIFAREIESYAGSPADLVARQKGIEYFRAGIATPAFNIRGFNSNFNAKNLQVNDGRFSTLIATGLPLGPLIRIKRTVMSSNRQKPVTALLFAKHTPEGLSPALGVLRHHTPVFFLQINQGKAASQPGIV